MENGNVGQPLYGHWVYPPSNPSNISGQLEEEDSVLLDDAEGAASSKEGTPSGAHQADENDRLYGGESSVHHGPRPGDYGKSFGYNGYSNVENGAVAGHNGNNAHDQSFEESSGSSWDMNNAGMGGQGNSISHGDATHALNTPAMGSMQGGAALPMPPTSAVPPSAQALMPTVKPITPPPPGQNAGPAVHPAPPSLQSFMARPNWEPTQGNDAAAGATAAAAAAAVPSAPLRPNTAGQQAPPAPAVAAAAAAQPPPGGAGNGTYQSPARRYDAPPAPQRGASPPRGYGHNAGNFNHIHSTAQGLRRGSMAGPSGGSSMQSRPRSLSAGAYQQEKLAAPVVVPADPAAAQNGQRQLRVRKGDGWARMVTYEACWQVCLGAAINSCPESEHFLQDGCSNLKKALGLEALTLRAPGEPGPEVVWDNDVAETVGQGAAEPWADASQDPTRRPPLRVSVLKLKSKVGGKGIRGLLGKQFDKMTGKGEQHKGPTDLYLVLRPRTRADSDAVVARPQGSALGGGGVLEVAPHEADEELFVQICDAGELLGTIRVPVMTLWSALEAGESAAAAARQEEKTRGRGKTLGERGAEVAATLLRRRPLSCGPRGAAADLAQPGGQAAAQGPADAVHPFEMLVKDDQGRPSAKITLGLARGARPLGNSGFRPSQARHWSPTPNSCYDLVLQAALTDLGCGPRRLDVTDPWRWLLLEFAQSFGVREPYAALTYLIWSVHPSRATPTADCFNMLLRELRPLKEAADEGLLQPTELQMFRYVCSAVDILLARCFENYKLLSEAAPSGIVHDGTPGAEIPAPALAPAVALFYLLRDPLDPHNQTWLCERFRTAARRRYLRLEVACFEDAKHAQQAANANGNGNGNGNGGAGPRPNTAPVGHGGNGGGGNGNGNPSAAPGPGGGQPADERDVAAAAAQREYLQLESLCSTLCLDLQIDMVLHRGQALPAFLNLPALVAEEYCGELVKHLTALLRYRPPTVLTQPAVKLLVAVGALQAFLVQHGLTPPRESQAYLDARTLFGSHVLVWVEESRYSLTRQCIAIERAAAEKLARERRLAEELEASGAATQLALSVGAGGQRRGAAPPPEIAVPEVPKITIESVSVVVKEMIQELTAEVQKYEEVIVSWTSFAVPLEECLCDILREVLNAVCRQSGGVPSHLRRTGHHAAAVGAALPRTAGLKAAGGKAANLMAGPLSLIKRGAKPHQGPASEDDLASLVPRLSPIEVRLLNSLKTLLSATPQLEGTLRAWCGGLPPQPTPNPQGHSSPLGARFGQLMKELRSEYAAGVKNVVDRLSGQMMAHRNFSVRNLLSAVARANASSKDQAGQAAAAPVPQLLQPLLSGLDEVLSQCHPLNPRVFVSVSRGLWDAFGRDVYEYVETLKESKENTGAWKSRQNAYAASEALQSYFRAALSRHMGTGLSQRDLDLPFHVDKVNKLLGGDNAGQLRDSFSVY